MLSEATWIHRAAAVFQVADTPLYIVGGAVRNPLMGLPISDVDVCGPARPEAVISASTPCTGRFSRTGWGR